MATMADQVPTQNKEDQQSTPASCVHLESVDRITKIPVVESTIQTATNIYEKVKDMNSVTNWTMSTAENTVQMVVDAAKPVAAPVIKSLDGPIKTVDGYLCTGLDYIESKVPAVKLPPGEIYENTKEYVSNNAAVQSARNMVEPAVISAKNFVEPAMATAKTMVEPAMATARQVVEPIVQPAVDKAKEFLHMDKKESSEETPSEESQKDK